MKTIPGAVIVTAMCIGLWGCNTRIDYAVQGAFRYYNKSGKAVRVELRQNINTVYAEYDIAPGDSITLTTTGMTGEEGPVDPMGYTPAILSDTTSIKFADTLCYTEYRDAGLILHKIGSYSYKQRGERDYIFYFIIDSSMYKLAETCR